MNRRLIINARETEKRYVIEHNGKIEKYYAQQPHQESLVGNIYLSIVEDIIPSMNAAFVQIGKGKKGYLHISQVPAYFMSNEENKRTLPMSRFIKKGDKIIVQVTKDETDKKYYSVSGNLEFAGNAMVYMPFGQYSAVSKKMADDAREKWKKWADDSKQKDEGLLIRTAADLMSENKLLDELVYLRGLYNQLMIISSKANTPSLLHKTDPFISHVKKVLEKDAADEVYCDNLQLVQILQNDFGNNIKFSHFRGNENIFSHFQVEKIEDELQKKVVWLPNGANIVIEEAEAFTIIDVNSAKSASKHDKERAIFETNKLAAIETARQIMIRNISGIILIDFINMKSEKNKQILIQILKQHFQTDENRTIIYGYTALGILELARKKTTVTMKQSRTVPCYVCNGTGAVPSPASVAFKLERELWEQKNADVEKIIVEASKDVAHFFVGENETHLKRLEETLHFTIQIELVENSKPYYYIKRVLTA